MKKLKSINPPTVLALTFFTALLTLFGCGETKNTTNTNTTINTSVTTEKTADLTTEKTNNNVILCFGNSLTEGYGLKPSEAYPALLQNRIDSLQLNYQVVNAGISGETTAGGLGRVNWLLKKNVRLFILELGANDGLRGIPLKETEKNLQAIIDTVKLKIPTAKIVLAGMQIPPNLGIEYTNGFKALFPRLANKNNVALIPFFLQDVAGDPELNQPDGIHPTAKGTKIVLDNIWEVIAPLLNKD